MTIRLPISINRLIFPSPLLQFLGAFFLNGVCSALPLPDDACIVTEAGPIWQDSSQSVIRRQSVKSELLTIVSAGNSKPSGLFLFGVKGEGFEQGWIDSKTCAVNMISRFADDKGTGRYKKVHPPGLGAVDLTVVGQGGDSFDLGLAIAGSDGKTRLVGLSEQSNGWQDIDEISFYDINGDGFEELFVSSRESHEGSFSTSLSIFEVKANPPRLLFKSEPMESFPCSEYYYAFSTSQKKGSTPTFLVTKYEKIGGLSEGAQKQPLKLAEYRVSAVLIRIGPNRQDHMAAQATSRIITNLRQDPSKNSKIIGKLPRGEMIEMMRQRVEHTVSHDWTASGWIPTWTLVKVKSGEQGWVKSSLLLASSNSCLNPPKRIKLLGIIVPKA